MRDFSAFNSMHFIRLDHRLVEVFHVVDCECCKCATALNPIRLEATDFELISQSLYKLEGPPSEMPMPGIALSLGGLVYCLPCVKKYRENLPL